MCHKREVVLFIATSLDGYIADEEETLKWLLETQGDGDNGYGEFYDTVDTILMGKRTYDWIMHYEKGNFPYKNKACYVFSRTFAGEKNEFVEFVNEETAGFTKKLMQQAGENIWLVGGRELLYHFLKEKLVDRFIITIAPAIIGKGIPLFSESEIYMDLNLVNVRRFNQFVQLEYERKPQV